MDKQEYLAATYGRLRVLVDDLLFENNRAQVRARAIQEQLSLERAPVGFTFDAREMWRYCDYIFSEGALLLREDFGDENLLLKWMTIPGETFEFLARFADEDEKEILLLNSAICYHIAGYQANARCLGSHVEEKYLSGHSRHAREDTPDVVMTDGFRHALASFLNRDVSKLQQITARSLSSVHELQREITRGLAEGTVAVNEMFSLIAHAYYQKGLSEFVQYCLRGSVEHFSGARTSIQKSHEYFQKAGDATLGTITSELRTALDLFNERSTWSSVARHANDLLSDPVWRLYLRNLAFDKSIVEFWPSQLRAIESGILTSEDGFVVQMPTSAGKTLIGELSMLATLTSSEHARCLYIAPYRALASEIENTLAETLGTVGYRVSHLMGGFELDAFEDFLIRESDVLVATPEKIELFLRARPEYFGDVSLIVVDEAHIVDEGIPSPEELDEDRGLLQQLSQQGALGRGPLLELLITRLKRRLPDARFVSLSAVMPDVNAADFVEWLCPRRGEPLRIDPSKRPSRQLIAKFEWTSAQGGALEYVSLPRLRDGRHPFVSHFIQRKRYLTGALTPRGRRQRRTWPDTGNKAQTTAMLATQFARTGPVLVFCAQPRDAKTVSRNIATSLKYLEASNGLPHDSLKYVEEPDLESFHLAVQWLGEQHPLTQALRRGVGLHYGPLPEPVRQAVEDEFRRGEIQILVSTSTLAQGVNMPVKTALIYSLERRWGAGEESAAQVKKRDFWNICGRAGRAGKETEGQVVFVVTSDRDSRFLEEYRDLANLEEINSALYKLLQFLVDRRIDQDELVEYLDSHVLSMLMEEVVDTQDEAAVRDLLGASLVGVQALRNDTDLAPLISAIKSTAAWVMNQVPDHGLRQVFASTGLSVRSCLTLEEGVELFLQDVTEDVLKAEDDKAYFNEDLLHAAFSACRDLPEMVLRRTIDYRGPDDEFELIRQWVIGTPISHIRLDLWDPREGEDFSEYVADRMAYKLPWGFNGFLRILAFKLQMRYEDLPIAWQHLPSMMKSGVDSIVACWAASLGVSSRQFAVELAHKYEPQNGISFSRFLKWIANLPAEFVVYDLSGLEFEKRRLLDNISEMVPDRQLLEFIRAGRAQLESPVRGIRFEGRHAAASEVAERDRFELELEPDNPYDQYAVRVLFNGKHIGYVQRDRARVLSREMRLGRPVEAYATAVRPATHDHPFPWIEMIIELG